MDPEKVVLVDQEDRELGLMDKTEAHQNPGRLHRAVSVVLYRKKDQGVEILMQRRSEKKLLWPGFWSNTVCTHPYPGEDYLTGGLRRLKEELGIEMKAEILSLVDRFEYQADYSAEWSEHELDTVLMGEYEGEMDINREEVSEVKWESWEEVKRQVEAQAERFTPWFQIMMTDDKILFNFRR